jgi:hypothetical protein
LIPYSRESHLAIVVDKSTGKSKTSTKEKPLRGGLQEKSSLLKSLDSTCFICGKAGHICRVCSERKSSDLALIVHDGDCGGYSDIDSEDDNFKQVAYVTSEVALFAGHILHLESQSSANVISKKSLLVKGTIRKAKKEIVLNSVDKDTPGMKIDLVGDMGDIDEVQRQRRISCHSQP